MAGETDATPDLGQSEVEMTEDSGYSGSKDSVMTDMQSQSGESTATLVGDLPGQSHGQDDSGISSKSTDKSEVQGPGTQTRVPGQIDNLSQATLPRETIDPASRTEQWVEETFEVFVKNLDGKTYTIEVDKYEEVSKFRTKVCEKVGVPGTQQRLTSQTGRTLEDGRSLCDYDIKKHSTVYCQGRLRGGLTD